MGEPTSRSEAAKRIKERFLQAIQRDDSEEVQEILHTTNLDIDTVLEVEDKNMILASYKQGKGGEASISRLLVKMSGILPKWRLLQNDTRKMMKTARTVCNECNSPLRGAKPIPKTQDTRRIFTIV